ncbi:MAG: hypothetical protein D6B26_01875, partial [Spirochaetaceae bacterium]
GLCSATGIAQQIRESGSIQQVDDNSGRENPEVLPATPVDQLLSDLEMESLFGSLCHFVIEQRLRRPDTDQAKTEIAMRAKKGFRQKLQEGDWEKVYQAAEQLCDGWFCSQAAEELGILPGAAGAEGAFHAGYPRIIPERPFIQRQTVDGKEMLVQGIMDITIEYEDRLQIIDFKTDRNWSVRHHQQQMLIYKQAGLAMSGKPVEVFLVPLRSAKAYRVLAD